eukprot:COSAG06_NODE_47611_length_338_cov_0.648536_1_plen_78_part_10
MVDRASAGRYYPWRRGAWWSLRAQPCSHTAVVWSARPEDPTADARAETEEARWKTKGPFVAAGGRDLNALSATARPRR